jgi:aspartyl aminopeptidase
MRDALLDFLQFLGRSPTAFHAAREIANRLAEADFTPLKEGEKWKFEPGKGYFIVRGDSLVAAFRVPKQAPASSTILASHIDSPALKLKPTPESATQKIGQFGVEVYGAPLLHTWLDRDLSVSGRISILDDAGKISSALVHLDDYPVVIPGLALHLDRSVSEKGLLVHRQDHLKPIFSLHAKEKHFEECLRRHHPFQKILGFDLFLTPLEKPAFLGFDSELIGAYRLDNLTSAYAALQAILSSSPQSDALQMALFWDHEEIGSMSFVGADSLFANQILERVCLFFKMDREDYYRLKSRSLCISADLAHGFHPNYTDKYDPQNAPFLGKGVIFKFNANQKYATSGSTAAQMAVLAEKKKIAIQKFASRSDIPSGSTVGSIMAANLGVPAIDLGIAGWAMHSARETIAAQDELSLIALLKAALEEKLPSIEEM